VNRDVTVIETLAFRAWPAEVEEDASGWMLRCSPGLRARRINSATTPVSCPADVDVIPWIVEWFTQRGAHPLVRVLSVSDPAIDLRLEAERWRFESTTLTVTRDLDSVAEAGPGASIESKPSGAWVEAKRRLTGMSDAGIASWLHRAAAIEGQAGFASIAEDARVVSIGLGVIDGDRLGVFDLITDPAFRRRGLGRSLVAALERWACALGATRAYLQLEAGNAPAVSLYRDRGYAPRYSYWYRRMT
jgi:GNAT superfamily N-acetyltransferase